MAEDFTPDLTAAGAAGPPANPAGLMDAMRSQGTPPAGLMAALAPQPLTGPSQAAYALTAGLNPTGINPVERQQNVEQEQRMQQVQLLQRAQQHQQQLEFQKASQFVPLFNDLLKSDSEAGRVVGAKGMENILRSQGQQVPEGFAESFRTQLPSLDKRKEAYMAILAAKDNPSLQGNLDQYLVNSLKIPTDMIDMVKQEAASPMVHKLFFGKTPQEEQAAIDKANLDQMKYDLTVKKQDALEARQAAEGNRSDKRLQLMEGNQQISQARLDLAMKAFEFKQANGPQEKQQKALDQAQNLTDQLDAVSHQLKDKGYLPKPGMSKLDPGYFAVLGKRTLDPNDPSWQTWVKHLQPAMIGFARNVQGDIGPRAMQAFQGAQTLMDNPPDIKSIEEVVRNMRLAVKLGREGKDTAASVYIKQGATGNIIKVPWKRGMEYAPGDSVVKVE